MQANPMRAALERGELQIGSWVNMVRNPGDPAAARRPRDWISRVSIWSTPAPTWEEIAQFGVAVARTEFSYPGCPPKANRESITRLLDAEVWNLHCPQVANAAHAAEIVAASRYAPRGLRGNAGHIRAPIST